MDLFEQFEKLPTVIQDIINSHGDDFTYKSCDALLAKLKAFGYEFEYGLDAVPHSLREIKIITRDDFDDVVKDILTEREWAHICVEHAEVAESQGAMIADGGGATCGIEGCANESLHYIDL